MTAGDDEATFPARHDDVAATAAFVAAFCGRHGVGREDMLRLALVVEELFLNIVTHGYGDDTGGTVRVALAMDRHDVMLVCEDRARAYDPRAAFERAPGDLDAPLESRGVGGLGQWIVGQLVEVERYERADDANRLTLRLRRSR